MDKDVAAEVGKIAALVARLGRPYRFWTDGRSVTVFGNPMRRIAITKTRKARRIPMLRALTDMLRAELKEQAKCKL